MQLRKWLSAFVKMSWSPLVLAATVGVLTGCTFATIRPLDPTTGKAIIGNESEKFNAASVAGDMWESKVLPALEQGATASDTLLTALRADLNANAARYGHRDSAEHPYSFMIKGSGKVVEVNTTSRVGLANVDTNNDGKADLALAIGPVIRGTALRDSMPFINFNQFTNQVEYASISNQLNALVNDKILKPIGDPHTLEGKTVTFSGAFTLGANVNPENVVVTPAILTIAG